MHSSFCCFLIILFFTRSAQIAITLANEGPEAYKPHLYGEEIQIIRKIGLRQSSYATLSKFHELPFILLNLQ